MKYFLMGFVSVLFFVSGWVAPQPKFIRKHFPRVSQLSEYELKGERVVGDFKSQHSKTGICNDLIGEKVWVKKNLGDWKFTKNLELYDILDYEYKYDNHITVVVNVYDYFEITGGLASIRGLVKINYNAVFNQNTNKLIWFVEDVGLLTTEHCTLPPRSGN